MSITVRHLVDSPDLKMRVLAGASGLQRQVTWAHVCELPSPTEWLSEGELLMTVGYTIPEEPSAQESYIEQLAEAKLGGLLIAERLHAPKLSAELVSVAERHSFPVLLNSYEVPFTAVARMVADANQSMEHARLAQVLHVYERARQAVSGGSGSQLLSKLGDIVCCDLFIIDPENGRSLLPDAPGPPPSLVFALRAELDGRPAPMPAILRVSGASQPTVAVPVPASRSATLVAVARDDAMPETSILHHIAGVAALEVEKLVADYERRRQLGSELLAGLVDGRFATDLADHLLVERELSDEPRVLASCPGTVDDNEHSDLHLRLEDRGIPHLLLRRTPVLTALLPAKAVVIEIFREEVSSTLPVGLSDLVGSLSRVPDAYREARWALQSAKAAGKSFVKYGDDSVVSPFLPRSVSEAHRIVEHVLGPLLEYDAANNSYLVVSLKTFLSHQRSWQRAAASLHVHRQTLIYRMRRIEELTGRQMSETADVAEFWLALTTAQYSDYTEV